MTVRIPVVLGIDAGTTSVKTVAFSLAGEILGVARATVGIVRSDDGAAESDMDEVWQAAVSTVVDALGQVRGGEVIAIGVTGQGDGAWLLDADDRPLRKAALWLDGRAVSRVDQWLGDGRADGVHDVTGSPLFAGALPVLVDELAAREPGLMALAATHLNCKDWIRYRLVGVKATDPSEASRTYLDTGTLEYSARLFAQLGQSAVPRILPPVQDPYRRAGVLTEEAARQLHLRPGIPVAVGLVDTAASAVGLGAVRDGDGYIILGTTCTVAITHPSRGGVKTGFGIVIATGRDTQVIETFSTMSGTPNLDWIRSMVGMADVEWHEVEREARAVDPGSGGVVYLPYASTSGERAPFYDGNASASFHGTNVTTRPAALVRSVFEGLAFSLTECMDLLDLHDEIAVCGGGSDSELMCEILADVSGRRIVRQEAPEVGARGAASVALLVSGQVPDLASAIEALRPSTTTFEPDPERHRFYRRALHVFLGIRASVRDQWGALRALRWSDPQPREQ